MVVTTSGLPTAFEPSMLLGLQDAGVDARVVNVISAQQYGAARDIWRHPDAMTRLDVTDSSKPPPHGHRIATFELAPTMSAARYAALDRRMRRWADAHTEFPIDPRSQIRAARNQSVYVFDAKAWLHEQQREGGLLPYARFLERLALVGIRPQGDIYDVPGMTPAEIRAWAAETVRRHDGTFYMYETSLAPPAPTG